MQSYKESYHTFSLTNSLWILRKANKEKGDPKGAERDQQKMGWDKITLSSKYKQCVIAMIDLINVSPPLFFAYL